MNYLLIYASINIVEKNDKEIKACVIQYSSIDPCLCFNLKGSRDFILRTNKN